MKPRTSVKPKARCGPRTTRARYFKLKPEAPSFMYWAKGAIVGPDPTPGMGRPKGGARVLYSELRLLNHKRFRSCLQTNDEELAKKRMGWLVAGLVKDGKLSADSVPAQLYCRRQAVSDSGRAAASAREPLRTWRSARKAARPRPAQPRQPGQPVASAADCFRWQEAVFADGWLSFARRNVLVRLGLHHNGKTGRCDPSIETLAAELGLEPRSVQRAIRNGEMRGWLITEIRPGRTRSNRYTLVWPLAVAEKVTGGSPFIEGRKVTGEGSKGDSLAQKRGPASHPNTKNTTNTPRERASALPAGALARAQSLPTGRAPADWSTRADRRAVAHAALNASIAADDAREAYERADQARWSRVCERLRARLGGDIFSNWFEHLELETIEGVIVRLSAPTRFIVSWIRSHYAEDLLSDWQSEDATLQRVELVARGVARRSSKKTSGDQLD